MKTEFNPNAPTTLQGIVDQCESDSERWFPDRADDLPFMVLALAGEVGELANHIKKMARGSVTYDQIRKDASEEAIDIFIYLCNIFAALGIDPVAEYHRKREFNERRFGNNAERAARHGGGS